MPVMLERWNDDKMDGLAAKVDRLGEELREQRREAREQRQELREQRQEMKAGFERVDDRFERMHRLMVTGVLTLSGAYVAGFAALVGLVATQL
jgi:hypothetical protein